MPSGIQGPLPLLDDRKHDELVKSFRERVPAVLGLDSAEQPRAIVVVSAHWQTEVATVSSAAAPGLVFDYNGFPPEAYAFKYPAKGDPGLAHEIKQAFEEEELAVVLDSDRGWDHGMFVPMTLVRPAADIPIIQLSVLNSEDPNLHIRYGSALRKLRDTNVAILGSGFPSFHNLPVIMSMFSGPPDDASLTKIRNDLSEWNDALTGVVSSPNRDERLAKLEKWRELPNSYFAHPKGAADHFLPLLVCVGAVDEADGEVKTYSDQFLGVNILTYYWSPRTVE